MPKNENFDQKSKFLPKIKIFTENRFFYRKSKCLPKIQIFIKNGKFYRNFYRKSKFFAKSRNFYQKSKCGLRKISDFEIIETSEIEISTETSEIEISTETSEKKIHNLFCLKIRKILTTASVADLLSESRNSLV